MARKKEPETNSVVDIDEIIDTVSKGVALPPTNLQRGTLVKDAVSTGSLALDLSLGGGWAPGRRCNVFGKEQVGKSTLLYFAIKACIAQRVHVILYDWEGSTDSDRVERIGVKTNWMAELKAKDPVYFRYYDRMKHGQQMFSHAMQILDKLPDRDIGPVQVAFFCDSLPTVLPAAQAEDSDIGTNALRASLYSNQLPVIKSRLSAKRCIWIDTNQIRTNPRASYGNPEYEMCGEAVKTLSDVRVKAKRALPTKGRGRPDRKTYIEEERGWNGGVDRYNFAHLTVTKNKAFSPNRECDIRIWYEENGQPGRGIDPVYDCYEYLRLTGQIEYVARPTRHFRISFAPFNEERRVTVPAINPKTGEEVVDAKTGEVKMLDDTRTGWTWDELKDLILNPANSGKGRERWNLVVACRKQIQDGTAFRLYFETITNAAIKGIDKAAEE